MKPVYVKGLPPTPDTGVISSAIRNVILKATDNLAWLSAGETVLLKPALNSPDPYPSTTHPLAVSVTAGLLADRGAKVVIGDQSGIEHVLHHPGGVIHGRTIDNYARSGMGGRNDTKFVGFEDGGWDEGFFHHHSANTASWRNGFYVTLWAKKVDHIISLPRVSAHAQAGATLGLKSMVGMLREDSRMEFHANGPLNGFIVRSAKGSTLKSSDDGTETFFEKIVEISDAIREKLRLTLYVATAVQATFGPNQYGIRLGRTGLGRAYVVQPEPGLIFGSADQIAAESVALAVLKDAKGTVPLLPRCIQRMALFSNPYIPGLDLTDVCHHPYIRHGMKIGLGEMPGELVFEDVPMQVRQRLNELLKQPDKTRKNR
ncbi:MAG: DUF362 domain-containing protein [Methanoregula sp.]|uniref:DUF362 domain-containing protein n=1 Tax=Methanoregula sp. TaxID=2052170 RepID=UPI003BAEF6AE